MPTDTSERGLERLICTALTGYPCDPGEGVADRVRDAQPGYGGVGWVCGAPEDYDRAHCVDMAQLAAFLRATQPELADVLALDEDGPARRKFLGRLQGEVERRGVVAVLRGGIKHGAHHFDLFYGAPSVGNEKAQTLFEANHFSVTRQLRYSRDNTQLALDLGLFINGLPVATFELKNSLTKQTVEDAVEQYKRDRDPREKLFAFGRCLAHFAVDDNEVRFCTHLKGKASWFLPFNRGWNDGAGNPPNPGGIKTSYLWREVLTRESLTDIIGNYAQLTETKDPKTGRKSRKQIWPRYHQLDVVRKLLTDAGEKGAGQRYLIQHSAGSGKSNSIAWLARQLIDLSRDDAPVFDSIIVVTDRNILDQQINETIKQFAQVSATVGHAERSGDLRKFIESGKKIIISTVQKFRFILDEIGNEQRSRRFAIIIDEAHSSQGGKASAAMGQALSEAGEQGEDESTEDKINRLMESRKLLPNASYFAFTATPKNKTLEIFGAPEPPQSDGKIKHRAFHNYTMKQAIQEGFILDVLTHYMPVDSYYELGKAIPGDPSFDVKKAQKKLRRYVEGHEHTIRIKAGIMVDHFHDKVLAARKIGGEARAMVVTSGVARAIDYFDAINSCLKERKSRYKAIVAFSGEREHGGKQVSEASLNGFSSKQIADEIREDPYRFLVCADKFQTGYDEPLLHTMYVDKELSGIKAVQTLSRLNRAHPKKRDVFVLDFRNDADVIRDAFADYYQATILSEETDPNKLHDLKAQLDGYQVYALAQVDELVEIFLNENEREKLDPILDACVAVYMSELDEDGQVSFKGKAKTFTRTYNFLSMVLPWSNAGWEKLSIFLNLLIPKLPAPREEDLSRGILEAIDMESYRAEKQAIQRILLPEQDAEIDPVPTSGGGHKPEPELERVSRIIREFNERFGNIGWEDRDRVQRLIAVEVPRRLQQDTAYKNACANAGRQNARTELKRALMSVIAGVINDDTQLFNHFTTNDDFKRWLTDKMFDATYEKQAPDQPQL